MHSYLVVIAIIAACCSRPSSKSLPRSRRLASRAARRLAGCIGPPVDHPPAVRSLEPQKLPHLLQCLL